MTGNNRYPDDPSNEKPFVQRVKDRMRRNNRAEALISIAVDVVLLCCIAVLGWLLYSFFPR